MTTEYTPVNAEPATITLPVDGEDATVETVNIPLRQVANRTQAALERVGAAEGDVESIQDTLTALDPRIAFKDQANTFVEPQTVQLGGDELVPAISFVVPNAETPLLASTKAADEQFVGNKWKLIGRFKRIGGNYAYVYVGTDTAAVGGFAVVVNAYWIVGEQKWAQEDTASESHALVWRFDQLRVWKKAAASSTHWTNAEWGRGRVEVGDLNASANIGGDVIHAVQEFHCTNGDYLYTTPWARETLIDGSNAKPRAPGGGGPPDWEADTSGSYGFVSTAANAVIEQPFKLPGGAHLEYIDVFHVQGLIAQDTMLLRIMNVVDWTNPGLGFDVDDIPGDASFAGNGARVTRINVNQDIDPERSYRVVFTAGLSAVRFVCMRLVWTDPGPRNF